MATNKRKEAAALFELIGNSTLKVPKGAGSLKIPNWWSSKTNPPAPPTATDDDDLPPMPTADDAIAAENAAPAAAPAAVPVSAAPAADAAVATAATPLFDITADGAASAAPPPPRSVSIRPPARAIPVHVAGAPAAPSAAPAPVRRPRTVFAPQTVDQSNAPPPLNLQRRPALMLTFVAAGLITLVGGLYLVFGGHPAQRGDAATTHLPVVANANGFPVIDRPVVPVRPAVPATTRSAPAQVVAPQPVAPPRPGQVLASNQVRRDPNLNYFVIVSSQNATIAQNNAAYIAAHGVDVTVERKGSGWYQVVSVVGFPKLDDPRADALRKQVVAMGREHAEARTMRKGIYDGAYYSKGFRLNP